MTKNHLTFVRSGAERDLIADANISTRMYDALHVPHVEDRVRNALPSFLAAAEGSTERGLCSGLVDRHGRLVSVQLTPLKEHPVLTVVVGRHTHVDLRADDPELALRHVALVYTASDPHRVRAFDLRAEAATKSRGGDAINAALASMPTVFQLGSYLLLVAATPLLSLTNEALLTPSRFGGYAAIEDETQGTPYLFLLADFSGRSMKPALTLNALGTHVLMDREPTSNISFVRTDDVQSTEQEFRPTTSDLARGVLIGRYERCDAPVNGARWSEDLSRVHALMFSTDTGVYICDLGSMVGIEHEQLGKVRLKHIQVGDRFWLGGCRLSVIEALS